MDKKAIREASVIDLFTSKKSQWGNYGFILEWDELDEELKNRKIVEYAKYNTSEYEGAESMEDSQIIETWGDRILSHISAYFPMYF